MSSPKKRLLGLLALIATASPFCGTALAEDKMPWAESLASAQQTAAASNKLMMIHFTADNCLPCRRLEKNVFSQATFVYGLTTEFVPVKVNVNRSPQVAEQFRVKSWPTDIVLTPSGQEVGRFTSPQDTNQYLSTMRQLSWRVKSAASGETVAQFPVKPPKTTMAVNRPMPGSQEAPQTNDTNQYAASNLTNNYATTAPAYQQNAAANTPGRTAIAEASHNAAIAPVSNPQDNVFASQENSTSSRPAGSPSSFSLYGSHPAVSYSGSASAAASHSVKYAAPTQQVASSGSFDASRVTQASSEEPHESPPQGAASTTYENDSQFIVNEFASANSSTLKVSAPPTLAQSTPDLNPRMNTHGSPTPTMNQAMLPTQLVAPSASLAQVTQAAPTLETASEVPKLQINLNQTSFQEAAPARQPSLAMEGFCPVTLADANEWIKGDRQWGARHRGRIFLFHSLAAQQKFLADPEKYSPILVGYDPVALAKEGTYLEGKREHGIRYKDHIVMFHSEVALEEFADSPHDFMQTVSQVMQNRPQTMMR